MSSRGSKWIVRRGPLAVGAISVIGLGFLIGSRIVGDSSVSPEAMPKLIVTQGSDNHIRTLGAAPALPALAAPRESTSEVRVESTIQTSEYTPSETEYSPAPEAEEKTPQPNPSPEITVAPNE